MADRQTERLIAELVASRRRLVAGDGARQAARQETLWAELMAKRPGIMAELVTMVDEARLRLAGSAAPPRHAEARSDDA
ncbi:MAG TPA: hypothetical protein VGH49_00835 [Xanthobacteraceae bacterium]